MRFAILKTIQLLGCPNDFGNHQIISTSTKWFTPEFFWQLSYQQTSSTHQTYLHKSSKQDETIIKIMKTYEDNKRTEIKHLDFLIQLVSYTRFQWWPSHATGPELVLLVLLALATLAGCPEPHSTVMALETDYKWWNNWLFLWDYT